MNTHLTAEQWSRVVAAMVSGVSEHEATVKKAQIAKYCADRCIPIPSECKGGRL